MKRLVLLFIFISSIVAANAQTAVLEHEGASSVYTGYNALVDAYNAAEDNDKIYLSGGTFVAVTFAKPLAIYGAGYHPEATTVNGKTYFNTGIQIDDSATGFKLEGVEMNGNLTVKAEGAVVKACKIGNCYLSGSNVSLINNVISGATVCSGNASNHMISNNIMMAGIEGISYSTISNNVIRGIVGSYNANRRYVWGDNNTVINNICCDATESYIYEVVTGNNNTIHHNVCWHGKITNDNAGNIASDNTLIDEAGRAALFVNVPTNRTWRWDDDYHLATSYTGSDSTPVGIFGGSYPMKEYYLPSTPHLVGNSSAIKSDAEGKLHVRVIYWP